MKMGRKKIVIVEDDKFLRQQIGLLLSKDYEVMEAGDRLEGEKVLVREKPELALIDLHMPPTGKVQEGMKLLESVKENQLDTIVIVMSADADRKATLRAVESGAYDFFRKPFDLDELRLIIRRALEKREIERENERLRKELQSKYSFDRLIGQSPGMLRVFEAVKRVADT
ncbi:MAG TPA: response regulator, partial [Acidobacteriota bacterium]